MHGAQYTPMRTHRSALPIRGKCTETTRSLSDAILSRRSQPARHIFFFFPKIFDCLLTPPRRHPILATVIGRQRGMTLPPALPQTVVGWMRHHQPTRSCRFGALARKAGCSQGWLELPCDSNYNPITRRLSRGAAFDLSSSHLFVDSLLCMRSSVSSNPGPNSCRRRTPVLL